MSIPFVDLKNQYQNIQEEINQRIQNVLYDTAFINGKYAKQFEAAFASFCHAKHCIGVGNGTDAIYIALRSLGIGPGDEVITAANSFIATSEAITMTGAKVVFADCHPDSYNLDPERISSLVSPRTKAIVPVHLYGRPAGMTAINEMAKHHGLYVIEDAAQAHGAEIQGNRIGNFGDIACFSFYPGKNLGAYGDAGAIVTNNDDLATQCRMIANHGRVNKYDHEFEGINSRLDGIQAAVLQVKLNYLEEWTELRRHAAKKYDELLKEAHVITPSCPETLRHVYHLYVIRTRNRDDLQKKLQEKGVATGIHYPIALPNLRAYQYLGHSPQDFPVSSAYADTILSLPMFPEITDEQIDYVCKTLIEVEKELQ